MRREFPRIGRQHQPLANALDFRMQRLNIRGGRNGGKYAVGFLGPERVDARKLQGEFRSPYPIKRVGDLVGHVAFDITDEAQRDVIVFNIDPSGTWQTTAQERQ
eukprot:gene1675-biopygen175